jgi:hypothetical protein
MVKKTLQPASRGGLLPIALAFGGFFLFLVIAAFVWLDRRPPTVAFGGTPPEERRSLLREQKERDREMLERYGWIDRDAGVVRLPVERAMELLVEEMNQGQAQN